MSRTNVEKLIELDNSIIDVQKDRATAFSNKQWWTAQSVSFWSNRSQKSDRDKIFSEVKAGVFEIVMVAVLTFLAGKYLSK